MKLILTYLMLCLPFFINAQVEEAIEMEQPIPPRIEEKTSQKTPPKSAWHGQHNGRYGFYIGNEWVIPPLYDELDKEYTDFIKAKKGNKYGAIDRLNKVILPFEYDKIYKMWKPYKNWSNREWNGKYSVEKNGKKGILDRTGKVIIPVIYASIYNLKNNMYSVGSEETGFGIIDETGQVILPLEYEKSLGWKDKEKGILTAQKNGKIGWITLKGEVVLPFEYEELKSHGYPTQLFYSMKKEGKWGFLDLNGKEKIKPQYDYIDYRRGLVTITKDGKRGLLNRKLKEIVPPKYYSIKAVSKTYLRVAIKEGESLFDRRFGLIDTLGKVILPTEYQEHIAVWDGDIIFAQKRKEPGQRFNYFAGYNKKGKQVIEPIYTNVKRLQEYFIATKNIERNKEKALLNVKGEPITPFIYDRFETKRDRENRDLYQIIAYRNDSKGIINPDGSESGDFKPMNSAKRQTEAIANNKKTERAVFEQIKGEWYGLTKPNTGNYLTNISFLSPESGIRTVYYLKEGEECAVEYYFTPKILSSMNTITTPVAYRDMTIKCDKPSANFLAIKDRLMFTEILNYSKGYAGGETTISRYSRKESPATVADNYDTLRKIKAFKELVKELVEKVESRPGGLNRPKFSISEKTNEVFYYSMASKYILGKIVQIEGEYVFEPREWATDQRYSLSGIFRGIKYKDKDGKVKTGDLDIGFLATQSQPFLFKISE